MSLRDLLATTIPQNADNDASVDAAIRALDRLEDIAPEMASLLIDMAEDVDARYRQHQRDAFNAGGGPCVCGDCRDHEALLARYRALEERT